MIFASGPLQGTVWGTVLAKPPNPNDVVGGWVAFFVVLAMGAAVVFLYFSLKKQLGKVNFEEEPEAASPDDVESSTQRPDGQPGGTVGGRDADETNEPAEGEQRPTDHRNDGPS